MLDTIRRLLSTLAGSTAEARWTGSFVDGQPASLKPLSSSTGLPRLQCVVMPMGTCTSHNLFSRDE
ncbi:hypothetical protein M419DRAFT_125140 [Trichoderma reesei RUT C-30]|uniref:Uncharacterized protein n=1 Tax=Hypocrea jecorina (strain ATCC 56765 / BCRC 32924 / NRRL 11460 / Rut C-30) TaxID=1344414 RepID=A0A024RXU8_HYPJR|nr:hypothetical protein M419DRAFT_125140 [Trichoderma reesei RUT C-30]